MLDVVRVVGAAVAIAFVAGLLDRLHVPSNVQAVVLTVLVVLALSLI